MLRSNLDSGDLERTIEYLDRNTRANRLILQRLIVSPYLQATAHGAMLEGQVVEPDEIETDLGFFVQALTDLIYFRYRLAAKEGVFVSFVEPGSEAQEAGLSQAQVIIEIDGEDVHSLEDFQKAMDKVKGKARFLVVAQNGRETKFLLFKRRGKGRDSSAGRAADS